MCALNLLQATLTCTDTDVVDDFAFHGLFQLARLWVHDQVLLYHKEIPPSHVAMYEVWRRTNGLGLDAPEDLDCGVFTRAFSYIILCV